MGFLKLNKSKITGISLAVIILVLSLIFLQSSDLFYFMVGMAAFIAGLPFFIFLIVETKTIRDKNEMFLEFSRDLVEGVRAGTPISRSIINIRNKNYGSLNPYIEKLANQISLGIPIQVSFETFARDAGSPTITRAITIIGETERAGGQIEDILASVAHSVSQSEKLRKERSAAMYNLIVQGYIIFLIFIIIMIVMQFKILPIASDLSIDTGELEGSSFSASGMGGILYGKETATPEQLARPFIWLLLVQGFFAGLVIGKLSEGRIMSGLKHSFVLVMLSIWINAGAKLVLG